MHSTAEAEKCGQMCHITTKLFKPANLVETTFEAETENIRSLNTPRGKNATLPPSPGKSN